MFNETSPNETSEEREAKRNIITSLVTGIAAMSNPNGAATANNAATANVDNNWLATQQIVQATKELKAAKNPAEELLIAVKWAGISGRQDLLTGSGILKGFTDGMAGAGLGSLDSAAQLMAHPIESVAAMKEFAATADGKKLLGAASEAFDSQLTQISDALEHGGDANAENLGNQMGQAVALVVSLVAGGGTDAAKGALALSKMGVDVTSSAFQRAAAIAKAGGLEGKLAKLERIGPDLDVPVIEPKPVEISVKTADGAKPTTTPRIPLAGPTENWKIFVNAENQIQLDAGAIQRVDQVINETLSGKKNFTSSMTLTTDEALSAGQKYLGSQYREIGKPGSGVFHSADGTKEFRIDSGSLSGAHAPGIPHVHFGVKDPMTGSYISNNHVPYAD
ncbi:hypothetical protein [Pseudomonas helvetica]|uniref:hypothetical protein n=1 Tax=Pseudomonas helvetica TaxID=3136738 RepID=UPI003263E003